jgi:hypothetical protein
MSMSTRRVLWYVVLPLLLVTVGLVAFWVFQSISSRNELAKLEKVIQLASVPVSEEPGCLAWSADGSYLAAEESKTGRTSFARRSRFEQYRPTNSRSITYDVRANCVSASPALL